MRQERKRRRKQRKSAFETFDLTRVNEEITEFLANSAGSSSSSLELPDFSKMQRMQVSRFLSSLRVQYPAGLMSCLHCVYSLLDRARRTPSVPFTLPSLSWLLMKTTHNCRKAMLFKPILIASIASPVVALETAIFCQASWILFESDSLVACGELE